MECVAWGGGVNHITAPMKFECEIFYWPEPVSNYFPRLEGVGAQEHLIILYRGFPKIPKELLFDYIIHNNNRKNPSLINRGNLFTQQK